MPQLALKGEFRPIIEIGNLKSNGFKILKTDKVSLKSATNELVTVIHKDKEIELSINLFNTFFIEDIETFTDKLGSLVAKFKTCKKLSRQS